MVDPFKDESLNPPRYKFVKGAGDATHESRLNDLAAKGYKATLMIFDEGSSRVNNLGIVVLMEREG